MPSAIVTTIGASTANSYVALADFLTYLDDRLDATAVVDGDEDDQIRALLTATMRLDQFNWLGERVNSTQALAWPRVGVAKRDGVGAYVGAYGSYGSYGSYCSYGEEYRSDEIPDAVKKAQMEFAFALLNGFNDGDDERVAEFSDDKMSVKYRDDRLPGDLPADVTRLLAGLMTPYRRERG